MNLGSVKLARSVAGAVAVGMAIAISSFGVVRAERAKPTKVKTLFNCSSGTACLEGNATNGAIGLYGVSAATSAILGITTATNGAAAIGGISLGTTGSANGVQGSSTTGYGVYGSSKLFGGVAGSTTQGTAGVMGYSAYQGGVYGETAGSRAYYPAISAYGDNVGSYLFIAVNKATYGLCDIDPTADLFCTGSISSNDLHERHRNSLGHRVLSYAAQSASATLEDFGTARMIGGVANVSLERDFAAVVDRSAYHVFLTPKGDASLYIAEETTAGFVVRETRGGRSTLDFDYRIVARPIDAKNDRLPSAPPTKPFGNPPAGLRSAH